MQAPCTATLLRIYIGEDDTFDDMPLCDMFQRLLRKCAS
jgi:hypothetical protein